MTLPNLQLNLSLDPKLALLDQLKSFERNSTQCLQAHFLNQTRVRELVIARSSHMDELLKTLWLKLALSAECSLIAVGGYGRGELHPHSDLDLLVLLPGAVNQSDSAILSQFIALLWDVGLKVGHAVRSIKECILLAKQDVTIITSLMESRLLVGDAKLFEELQIKTAPNKMWNAQDFFRAKSLEQKQRYRKYDGSSFDLEPNLKSSPGGLRDIHLIGWIAQRRYYPKSLFQLIQEEIITKKEYYTLIKNQLFLWRVRFALHQITGKAEDRLLFDYQKDAAKCLGFLDDEKSLAVEKMMKRYYRSVRVIRNITEILLQALDEKTFPMSSLQHVENIDTDYRLVNHRVDVIDSALFDNKPGELIRVFQVLASKQNALGLTANTLRSVRAARNKIGPKFIDNPINQRLFLDFWHTNHQSSRAMFAMKRSGILSDYLPAFKLITGQMQYDMFHSYTVDEHTLFLLRNLVKFTSENAKNDFPLCHEIMSKQAQPEIIYLAGLFHDIGKGRGGDHSEIGSQEALKFCQKHNLSDEHCELISWLVANHLIMSLTAQKRDTSDPKIIQNFAELMVTPQRLELLYILTVADIRATSASLWTSWKDSLLKELALATLAVLNHEQNELLEPWIDTRTNVRNALIAKNFDTERVNQYLQHVGSDYFTKNPADTIIWQAENILTATKDLEQPFADNNSAVIAVRTRLDGGGSEIFIYSRNQADLFAILTTTLAQHHLNVQGASIYTDKNDFCHDSFYTLNKMNNPTISNADQKSLVREIKKNLASTNWNRRKIQRRMPRQNKHFDVNTEIVFSKDEFDQYTRLDIVARDKPGLLSTLAQAFKACKIKLHDARITTLGEKVEDTFIISHVDDSAVSDPEQQKKLADAILKRVGI